MMALSFVLALLLSITSYSFALPSGTLARRARCFWPEGSLFHECEPELENQIWSGIDFSIWRYVEVDATSKYIELTKESLRQAATLYGSFLDGHSLEVKTYLTPQLGDGKKPRVAQTGTVLACHIELSMAKAMEGSDIAFQNTVAHELYHCVQQLKSFLSAQVPSVHDSENWWVEGTAVFMANYFYPDHSAEDKEMQYYDPRLPIYEPSNLYPAGLIFQHLYNTGWSPRRITDWMSKQTWTLLGQENEIARIATDPELTAAWPGFAAKFIDKGITFADGQLIDTYHTLIPEFITVTEGSPFTKKISIAPFQVNTYETLFAADKAVSMTWTPEEPGDTKTVVQYRQGTSGRWITAAPGSPIDLQNTATSVCPSGASNSWYFIITSTNDPARNTVTRDGKSHGTLSFTVRTPQRRRQECPQLDSCLIGNWALDNNAMAAFLSHHVASTAGAEGVVVANLAVTGVATFSVSDTFLSNSVFQAFTIGYDAAGISVPFHTDIVIDGTASGLIVPGANTSTFTWTQNAVTTGSVKTNTMIPSLDLEIPWEVSMDGSYGPDTVVQYTCLGEKLEMAGYTNGAYAWAYTWRRVA
jgi:hypothetical protein